MFHNLEAEMGRRKKTSRISSKESVVFDLDDSEFNFIHLEPNSNEIAETEDPSHEASGKDEIAETEVPSHEASGKSEYFCCNIRKQSLQSIHEKGSILHLAVLQSTQEI